MTYAKSALASEPTVDEPPIPMVPAGRLIQAITGLLAVLMPIVTAADLGVPGRPVLAVLYLLLVPGVPLAALIRLPSRLASATLAVAISVAVQLLLAQTTLLAGFFSELDAQAVASVLSLGTLTYASARHRLFAPKVSLGLVARHWQAELKDGLGRGKVTAIGLVVALALWFVGVRSIDPTKMNQYGLISVVISSTIAIAIALLALLAVIELRRPRLRTGWLVGVTVAFVLVLQGTPAAVEPAAGLPSAWVHVGFAEYIREHGAVLHGYDARFSWPGFFAMLANLTTSAGLQDGGEFLRWAPLFQDLLMLLPVVLLARRLSSSARLVWLSALLYTAGNWFQQDYLSPQGLALFLGMTVVALTIWSADPALKQQQDDARGVSKLISYVRPPGRRAAGISGVTRTGYLSLGAALILILLAIVPSHQLTPVALVVLLGWTAFARWTRFPGLWLVLASMTVAWVFYGATDYWQGHLHEMFGGVGSLGSSLDSGVTARFAGSPAHLQMLYLRLALSGACLLFALVGLYLIRRTGRALLLGGLCFAPFLLVAVQSYGGEVVIRALVFALPALAIASAEALGWLMRRGRQWAVLFWALLVVLGLTLTATRGANAPFERVTTTQLAAADALKAVAAPGSTLGTFNSLNPLGRLEPGRYYGKAITPSCTGTGAAITCTIGSQPDYLFVSSSEEKYGELVESRSPGWTDIVVRQLVASHKYSIVDQVEDAIVLKRVGPKA